MIRVGLQVRTTADVRGARLFAGRLPVAVCPKTFEAAAAGAIRKSARSVEEPGDHSHDATKHQRKWNATADHAA